MIFYSDLNGNLILDNTGDIKKDINESAILNSIKNILFTRKGSRRMLPEFGSNLNFYIFEPLDEITARDIGEEIFEAVTKWEDRIIFTDIFIKPDYDKNEFNCSLKYKIKNSQIEENFNFILRRI